jgi:hypothetical protein
MAAQRGCLVPCWGVRHGDASGGRQRRPRKLAALGTAGELARKLQELGDALDDAVRAVRAQDALSEGLCRRVYELWRAERRYVLEWHPTEIRADGKLVLAASAKEGRFVLPAFAAGLRALGMRAECTMPDVLRLAQQLAALESGAQSPHGFASFLYRGGALGFDAAQDESVLELAETLIAPIDESAWWAERSRLGVELWNDLAWRAAQAFDAPTLADRWRAPIERMTARAVKGELSLNAAERRALCDAAEDETCWARAEINLLLAEPGLRASLSTEHVAHRLGAVIEHSPELDARLPELLVTLTGAGTSRPTVAARILGAALGRRLFGLGVDSAALLNLAERIGPELVTGLIAYLDERNQCTDAVVRVLGALLQRSGFPALVALADVARMQPGLAVALMRAAFEARVPPPELATVLDRLPPASVLAVLAAIPMLLRVAEPVLNAHMAERLPEIEPLLPDFLRALPEAAGVTGAALLATQGDRFSAAGLQAILSAFVELGHGREVVMALWESRRASSGARIAAIAALEVNRALLAEALRRRGPNLMDPPEVRVALEELRWRQA